MSDTVKKEILMMYELAGDNDLKYYESIQIIIDYIADLEKEKDLLKEELSDLKKHIIALYNSMVANDIINNKELNDIEEI